MKFFLETEGITKIIFRFYRTQMLQASRELHKFFHDCKDVLGRILEKHHSMSDELGRDAGSVSALQRKHQTFLQDLMTLQSQVNKFFFFFWFWI